MSSLVERLREQHERDADEIERLQDARVGPRTQRLAELEQLHKDYKAYAEGVMAELEAERDSARQTNSKLFAQLEAARERVAELEIPVDALHEAMGGEPDYE